MARTAAKRSASKRTASKRSAAKRTSSRRSRPSVPPVTRAAATTAPAATRNVSDLAGGLKTLLTSVETEVKAVTALSQRIDNLVTELNAAREEQAQRLLALDALRGSARDGGLTSFLDKLIRPRQQRVAEVMPGRLSQ
jgi:hypothetical protein